MNETIAALHSLAETLERIQGEQRTIRDRIRRSKSPGVYQGYTVYEVPPVVVRRHQRRGFIAIRLNSK